MNARRPASTMMSQKMGIHEWSYDNEITADLRFKVPWADIKATLKNVKMEVELGFDVATAWKEAQRCLNCDVQTVFTDKLCIECDACVDICPMDCITFTGNGDEKDLRTKLQRARAQPHAGPVRLRPAEDQRVMVKDEDVCLHCGLCAERCPTGAWDMQKSLIEMTYAGNGCRSHNQKKKAAPPRFPPDKGERAVLRAGGWFSNSNPRPRLRGSRPPCQGKQ